MSRQVSPLTWDDEVGRIIVRGTGANDPIWTQVNATCTDAVMVPLVDLHYQRDDGVGTLSKSPTWSKV